MRLRSLGLDPESLSAIVVTHEHGDHIRGISTLSRRFNLPVYANRKTASFLQRVHGIELFTTGDEFTVGNLSFHSFPIVHDAADPVGYAVFADGLKLVHATDLGRVTTLVRAMLEGSNALVLESNYDPEMLQVCDYPWQLKQRIASTHGHLSNPEAAETLSAVHHADLLHVVLGHLSENSNTPDAALAAADEVLDRSTFASFVCGSMSAATPLFDVGDACQESAVAVGAL